MRYFIGYIVTIGLLIVLILFLVGSGGSGKHNTPPATPKFLNSYASTDAEVQLTADGPITGVLTHHSAQITVNAFQATFQAFQGYDGTVINTQSYANTQNAYYAFLSALSQAGFTKGAPVKGYSSDTGLCPLGTRYDVRLIQDGQSLEHYWITSCGGAASFKGNFPLTLELFQTQIPDYTQLTSTLTL